MMTAKGGHLFASKQRGFTLLELMLVMAVMAAMTIMTLQKQQRELAYKAAQGLGAEIYQYNTAVRSWLARNANNTSRYGTYAGTGWLKSSACGGVIANPEQPYLPCSFPDRTTFGGLSYVTTVADSGSVFTSPAAVACANDADPGDVTVCAETVMPALRYDGDIAPNLSGMAALTAAGGAASNLLPAHAGTTSSYGSDPATAVITMLASTNSTNDAWLRTDGGNTMGVDTDIRWDGAARNANGLNEIIGLDRIYNGIAAGVLRLGNAGLPSAPLYITPGVIVDADQEVLGALEVRASIYADGAIVSGGDVKAGRDLRVDRNAEIGNSAHIGNDLTVDDDLYVSRLIDQDNAGYSLDPNSTSRLSDIRLDGGKLASKGVYDAGIYHSFDNVSKPSCPAGSSPRIYTAVAGIARGSTPQAIAAVYAYAVDVGSSWTVRMWAMDGSGAYWVPGAYGNILAITKCQ